MRRISGVRTLLGGLSRNMILTCAGEHEVKRGHNGAHVLLPNSALRLLGQLLAVRFAVRDVQQDLANKQSHTHRRLRPSRTGRVPAVRQQTLASLRFVYASWRRLTHQLADGANLCEKPVGRIELAAEAEAHGASSPCRRRDVPNSLQSACVAQAFEAA
jgi:hypothetical protein